MNSRHWWRQVTAAIVVSILGLVAAGPGDRAAAAAIDTTAPVLRQFDIEQRFDSKSGDAEYVAVIRVRITDDLSGVATAVAYAGDGISYAVFRSPSGAHSVRVGLIDYASCFPDPGSALDCSYRAEVYLNPYAEGGTWRLEFVALYDRAQNVRTMTFGDARRTGFDSTFVVDRLGSDNNPPTLLSFSMSRQEVESPGLVFISIGATDRQSGLVGNHSGLQDFIYFRSPTGIQVLSFEFSRYWQHIDIPEITFGFNLVVPRFSEAGTWSLDRIELADDETNIRVISGDDVREMGFATTFEVTGEQDTEPPTLTHFEFETPAVVQGYLLSVRVKLADSLAGPAQVAGSNITPSLVRFRSPSGARFIEIEIFSLFNIDATATTANYRLRRSISNFAETGTWSVEHIILRDNVSNTTVLSRDDVAALGFPTSFEVLELTPFDANCDGTGDMSDVLDTQKMVAGILPDWWTERVCNADPDGDGELTSLDALAILRHLAGLD